MNSLKDAKADFEQIEILFDAMGDKTRRQIVYQIIKKNRTIKEIAEPLGITITGAAQHLKILENARIISSQKIGRQRICEFRPEGFEKLETFAKLYREIWQNRFSNLRELLEK